jgi:hypothetical protein
MSANVMLQRDGTEIAERTEKVAWSLPFLTAHRWTPPSSAPDARHSTPFRMTTRKERDAGV